MRGEVKMMDTRVMNTTDLIRLIREGQACGFNRQLDDRRVEAQADPDGVHVLSVVLPFHNGIDAAPRAHHRCEVLIRESGSADPISALIDVDVDVFDRLMKASDFLAEAAK